MLSEDVTEHRPCQSREC